MSHLQGFLLLTLQNCRLLSSTRSPPDLEGQLALICVTLDVDAPLPPGFSSPQGPTRDVWLVIRIGDQFEVLVTMKGIDGI